MRTTTKIEVRYPDSDMMGIVHHSVYPVWLEVARMEYFEEMGFSFSEMNKLGINPVMVDLHVQYKAPARYPSTLMIETIIGMYAPRKLQLKYEVRNEKGEIINTAETFHIWTGPDSKAYNLEENQPDVYERIKRAGDT